MSARRRVLAVAAGFGLAVASGFAAARPAGAEPAVTLSASSADPGDTVLVTLTGWTGGAVTVSVCGNEARRGSQDCDLRSAKGAGPFRGARPEVIELRIEKPPATCPCVVRVASRASDLIVVVPFVVNGVDTGPVVGTDRPGPPLNVTAGFARGSPSLGDRLRSSFGGRTTRTLEVAIENTSAEPVQVTLSAGVGRDRQGGEPLDVPQLEPLQPGEIRKFTIPVLLSAPSFGRYVVSGTVFVPYGSIRFDTSTSTTPTLLLAAGIALAVMTVVMRIRRPGRRAAAQPARPAAGRRAKRPSPVPVPEPVAQVPVAAIAPPPPPLSPVSSPPISPLAISTSPILSAARRAARGRLRTAAWLLHRRGSSLDGRERGPVEPTSPVVAPVLDPAVEWDRREPALEAWAPPVGVELAEPVQVARVEPVLVAQMASERTASGMTAEPGPWAPAPWAPGPWPPPPVDADSQPPDGAPSERPERHQSAPLRLSELPDWPDPPESPGSPDPRDLPEWQVPSLEGPELGPLERPGWHGLPAAPPDSSGPPTPEPPDTPGQPGSPVLSAGHAPPPPAPSEAPQLPRPPVPPEPFPPSGLAVPYLPAPGPPRGERRPAPAPTRAQRGSPAAPRMFESRKGMVASLAATAALAAVALVAAMPSGGVDDVGTAATTTSAAPKQTPAADGVPSGEQEEVSTTSSTAATAGAAAVSGSGTGDATTTPAPIPVAIEVEGTTGLEDGSEITVRVTADEGSSIYGFEVFLCKAGITVALDAEVRPDDTGNCAAEPLSAGSDRYKEVRASPPYKVAETTFRVGVGTDSYVMSDGTPVTITCGPGNPCQLVLKVQYPDGFGFRGFPLEYA